MKDYTLNKDEKRTFILSYRIEKDDIIVKFADNKELKYPYTIELEKSILEKMKEQVFKYIIDSANSLIKKKRWIFLFFKTDIVLI